MDGTGVRTTLAMNIKTLRNRRNWSQAELAEKSMLSIVYLSDIERGNKWPYLDTMVKLADAFKIEVYELLKPKNTPPPAVEAILAEYTEELTEILTKTFETMEKKTLQSLTALRDEYLPKCHA
jgi:transcriptional regulator with XRE-family HTH domain